MPVSSENSSLRLVFEGDNSIDAGTYASVLQAASNLVKTYDDSLMLRVVAERKGSFDVVVGVLASVAAGVAIAKDGPAIVKKIVSCFTGASSLASRAEETHAIFGAYVAASEEATRLISRAQQELLGDGSPANVTEVKNALSRVEVIFTRSAELRHRALDTIAQADQDLPPAQRPSVESILQALQEDKTIPALRVAGGRSQVRFAQTDILLASLALDTLAALANNIETQNLLQSQLRELEALIEKMETETGQDRAGSSQ